MIKISFLTNIEATNQEIDEWIDNTQYNDVFECNMIANFLHNATNVTTEHFSKLIDKYSGDHIHKLVPHIPWKKIAGKQSSEELINLSILAKKIEDKCSEENYPEVKRNIRRGLIRQFKLNILEIEDNITGVIVRSIPQQANQKKKSREQQPTNTHPFP